MWLEGKEYDEIATRLKISKQNLYTTIWQMREKGVKLEKRTSKQRNLTPRQRNILQYYAANIPIPEIAKREHLSCQTIQNVASQGFIRLGFTTPGVNRIVQLQLYFAAEKPQVTMDDPFLN